jgi:CRP-like cAMP-binding protein
MSLETDIALLRGAAPLHVLDSEALRLMAFAADMRQLQEEDRLFRKGDWTDGAYMLQKGRIALDASGQGYGAPFIAMPGTLIGRLGLFSRVVRSASATALEPSQVLRLSPSLMKRVWQEFPDALLHVRAALAQDLQELTHETRRVHFRLTALDGVAHESAVF